VKVRRGGVGTHFCIHKYFFSRNLSWKAIRDEEIEAEALKLSKPMGEPDLVEDEDTQDLQPLTFTPIDARHLSSLPLISARVVRLLKASKNHIHASNNMLITLVRCSSFLIISNLIISSGVFKSNQNRPSILSEPDP
jgi:oxalate---CoA ligase